MVRQHLANRFAEEKNQVIKKFNKNFIMSSVLFLFFIVLIMTIILLIPYINYLSKMDLAVIHNTIEGAGEKENGFEDKRKTSKKKNLLFFNAANIPERNFTDPAHAIDEISKLGIEVGHMQPE